MTELREAVTAFDAVTEREVVSRARFLAELDRLVDPFSRDADPVHVTGSAIVAGRRGTVLHWHKRIGGWMQPGGHVDPGETPSAAALREAAEETGLTDLTPWPDGQLRHLVIVDVPAGKGEPAHEHADLRYFMATRMPETARAENDDAPLRWLSLPEAYEATSEVNLRETLARLERLMAQPRSAVHP